ncbi:STAS domain-containing protein [Peterkaempfera sp. SMS 1(5)a]|uniref:STAS domain-containing protein n=1 Tax=Peterkaempfera podocarpi TaxID=3232308 RepID=UPI003670DE26
MTSQPSSRPSGPPEDSARPGSSEPAGQHGLTVEVSLPRSEVAVVVIEGELNADTAAALRDRLTEQLHLGRRYLILDLTGVPFMDSSGLNTVMRAQQETRRVRGSLRLAAPAPAVSRLIELTGVAMTVPVHGSVDEALAEHRRQVDG